jgi:hypothetical protein
MAKTLLDGQNSPGWQEHPWKERTPLNTPEEEPHRKNTPERTPQEHPWMTKNLMVGWHEKEKKVSWWGWHKKGKNNFMVGVAQK